MPIRKFIQKKMISTSWDKSIILFKLIISCLYQVENGANFESQQIQRTSKLLVETKIYGRK